jgi:hypothetical protein
MNILVLGIIVSFIIISYFVIRDKQSPNIDCEGNWGSCEYNNSSVYGNNYNVEIEQSGNGKQCDMGRRPLCREPPSTEFQPIKIPVTRPLPRPTPPGRLRR